MAPKRVQYSSQDLEEAIDEIKNGQKLRETSRKYKVPFSTLRSKCFQNCRGN